MRPSKYETMLRIAALMAERSTCERKQVGCVLTDLSMEEIYVGYNGGPKGGINGCRRSTPGNCGCLHAEVNAVAKAPRGEKLAFLTMSPCEACATLLVNAGVREVYFREAYRDPYPGFAVLHESQVPYGVIPHDV